MPGAKRKTYATPTRYYARPAPKRSRVAPTGALQPFRLAPRVAQRVNRLYRMIETKEGQYSSANNVGLPHNNTYIVSKDDITVLNPFQSLQQASEPNNAGNFNRIGDRITVRGLAVKGFVECALNRPKVFFRIMLLRCPRGQAPTRANGLFKGCSDNKMIDTINTEKFSIIWQTTFTCQASNPHAAGVTATGEPTASSSPAGIGTRTFSAWIPGKKFGKNGNVQYEDGSNTDVKFYDYRFAILCYDWYGTPQDVNNVGKLNEMYTKIYYKDA